MAAWPTRFASSSTGSRARSSRAPTPRRGSKGCTASSCPAASARAAPRARFSRRGSRASARCPISASASACRWRSSRRRARSLDCREANSTEFGPTPEPVVGLMTEWLRGNELEKRQAAGDLGGTMRLGAYRADLKPGSRIADIYGDDRDFRAPPSPIRGQHRLSRAPRREGPCVRRHVARRPLARDDRICRSSLVHRRAISSGAQVEAVRAASAVRELHRRGQGAEPAGVRRETRGRGRQRFKAISAASLTPSPRRRGRAPQHDEAAKAHQEPSRRFGHGRQTDVVADERRRRR